MVLGPALPTGLSLSGLQSAPLYNVSFGQTNGSGASTHTFRTWVNTTTVPAPNGGTPKTFSWPPKATIATQPSVLWDTGARSKRGWAAAACRVLPSVAIDRELWRLLPGAAQSGRAHRLATARDAGAYGQATVPQNVFNAFMEYYNASRPQARPRRRAR